MSPRPFDPMQRARDFTRTPSPRRELINRSVERRLEGVERLAGLGIDLATQPPGNSPIQYVTDLPEATSSDLGRQIILRLGGEHPDTLYVGMLGSSGDVEWIAVTSGDIVNSPEFLFLANVDVSTAPNGVSGGSAELRIAMDGTTDVRRINRSSLAVSVPLTGFPAANTSAWGIYYDNSSTMFVAVPGSNWIESYNGSSTATSPVGHRQDFWGLAKDPLSSSLYATDFAGNQCRKISMSTLQITASFATTGLSGPKGIACDASGNIFVADTGNNRIRKYDSSFNHLLDFGSAGNGAGLFNAPQGMAVDGADRLYVADSGNNRIQIFDCGDGTYLGKFGGLGTGNGQLDGPTDVNISGSSIDIADRANARISMWTRV